MAPKRELNNITPVQLAGAALGRTKRRNGLDAAEIAKVLAEAGIPPKRLRTDNEDLLIVNLTAVLEKRGWSKEQVTTDIVERCGPIRNWDAWTDDVVVMALHVEKEYKNDALETERKSRTLDDMTTESLTPDLTQTTITGQKMKPATQGAAAAQQQQQQRQQQR